MENVLSFCCCLTVQGKKNRRRRSPKSMLVAVAAFVLYVGPPLRLNVVLLCFWHLLVFTGRGGVVCSFPPSDLHWF